MNEEEHSCSSEGLSEVNSMHVTEVRDQVEDLLVALISNRPIVKQKQNHNFCVEPLLGGRPNYTSVGALGDRWPLLCREHDKLVLTGNGRSIENDL
ncbi:hypothetical protein RUM43_001074 [Polyplax serrata]|uniref:Uncharacterized protein n=1 Tax=Polyplax serrata TaxID=468196 RepID=A0AAN8XRG6_POLSC